MILRTERKKWGGSRSDGGFTLLEVLAVLAIAGLLLGVAIERGPFHSDTVTFGAASARAQHILQTARSAAMTKGHPVIVIFDAKRREFVTRSGTYKHIDRLSGPLMMTIPKPGGGVAARGEMRFDVSGATGGLPFILSLGPRAVLFAVSPVTGRILINGS